MVCLAYPASPNPCTYDDEPPLAQGLVVLRNGLFAAAG